MKTTQLLCEKVRYPQVDKEVEKFISNCVACPANGPETPPDQLKMTVLPPAPWHTVHIDFCGPFPTGEYFLVVIDAYPRLKEVDIVHLTATRGTISKLEWIFVTHVLPEVIKSEWSTLF